MRFVSQAAYFSLWCFVFVLPLDEITTLPVGSVPRLVGLVASGVGIVYILARRRLRQLSWFHAFAVLFVLWVGISSFWSIDPMATRARFMTYLQLAVLAWLIWEIAWSRARGRALLQAYVLGASVAAFSTLANYLAGVPMAPDASERFAALNQDPNDLGLTLVLGVPMAWYLSLSRARQRAAWLWQLYLPLAVTGVLLTASRASALSALVALTIVPWTQSRLRMRTRAALFALIVGSVVLAADFVPEASLERLRTTRSDMASGYFGGRGAIWSVGLEVAGEHPWLGVGAGAFELAVHPTFHRARAAHNVLLTVLVELGVIGFLLFVAMVLAAAHPLWRLRLVERRFWIVLCLALAVGSMSLSWGHRKQFWFVLALLAAQRSPPGRVAVVRRRDGCTVAVASPHDTEPRLSGHLSVTN